MVTTTFTPAELADDYYLPTASPYKNRTRASSSANCCSRACFLLYILLLWVNAVALLCVGIWWLADPAKSYALDLVDFSEDEPLLKFAVYAVLVVAGFALFTGAVGCVGALKAERCLVGSFIFFLILLLGGKLCAATMVAFFKDKFPARGERMSIYLANISQNRYHRDKWVLPVMDSVQFYHQCCGGFGPRDYSNSFWYITNTERGTRSFVPLSCCRQAQSGRAWAPVAIDPMCTTYAYHSASFNASVNTRGCGPPVKEWLDGLCYTLIGVNLGTGLIEIIGMVIGAVYLRQISFNYTHMLRHQH